MKILIDENKNFYKANMHSHSVYSDGKLTPEQIKKAYVEKGYSIVAFTDHEVVVNNSYLNDDKFLALVGTEISFKEEGFFNVSTLVKTDMKVCHLNAYSLHPENDETPCYDVRYDKYLKSRPQGLAKINIPYERKSTEEGINEAIKTCAKNGYLVSFNHPTWSLEDVDKYLKYEGLTFLEVFNGACNTLETGADDEHVYDFFLRKGKKLWCLAGDDNHNKKSFDDVENDSFLAYTMINADKLEYGSIIKALINGNMYVSTAPKIYSLVIDEDIVKIKTSPVKSIRLVNDTRICVNEMIKDGYITEAEFKLKPGFKYFRIKIIDENGNKALTQAYWL